MCFLLCLSLKCPLLWGTKKRIVLLMFLFLEKLLHIQINLEWVWPFFTHVLESADGKSHATILSATFWLHLQSEIILVSTWFSPILMWLAVRSRKRFKFLFLKCQLQLRSLFSFSSPSNFLASLNLKAVTLRNKIFYSRFWDSANSENSSSRIFKQISNFTFLHP